jgi:acyl dehydratase
MITTGARCCRKGATRRGGKADVPARFVSLEQFQAAVGQSFGPTPWLALGQRRIDEFAVATEDHQWIHVDPVRAARGPFGGTIAHGFLTLALGYHFLPQLIEAQGAKLTINYGCDRVRFPAVVHVDALLQARAQILAAAATGDGAVQVKVRLTIEAQGEAKPVCVAEMLNRYYF